jgi:cation diffusion facilitator family transporter
MKRSNIAEQRLSGVRRTLLVSLAANISLAIAKLIYGRLSGSLAMYADGFHSLLDAGASTIGLVGITLASRPPDPGHPYGYERYESLSSLAIGGFMMLAIVEIVSGAINRFASPQLPEITWLSFSVIGLSMVVSTNVSWWERRRARRFASELIYADAWHTFSDVLVSAAVMVSLIGGSLGIRIFDPVVALGVAVFLAWAAFRIIQRATAILSDAATVNLEQITEAAKAVAGVEDCHAVRARGAAGRIRVDLHIVVDGNMSVFQAHSVTEAVTETIRSIVPGIVEVLVHIGPMQKHTKK